MKNHILFLALSLLLFGFANGQSKVTGLITNAETGSPLPGANLVIEKLNAGTTTDDSGNFTITNLDPGNYTLEASFIGFKNKSIAFKLREKEIRSIKIGLEPAHIEISSVVITATRTKRKIKETPVRMATIDSKVVSSLPVNDVDDALQSISNVYVNRSWGIFSKNTSVTMRGLDGTQRTLVLLNGVPLNKVSGGQIQWALIRPEDVQRIEVIKGPGSALYGMNAMGGVINVITSQPKNELQLNAEFQIGSMNTWGGHFSARKNEFKSNKGFYWGVNGFYRQGDGYVIEPDETRDSIHVESYLDEQNASGLLGYQFNTSHKIEVAYDFHREKKGDGKQVFEDDGGYNEYQIHYARMKYEGFAGGWKLNANAFMQIENYDRQNESVNSTGVYRLYYTDSYKEDRGIWLTASKTLIKNNRITFGIDVRDGLVDSQDIYLTSTDEIQYKGKLSYTGFFTQDEIDLLQSKIKLIAGARIDLANYRDGSLTVNDPTSTTGFPLQSTENFTSNTWTSFSPKLSGMYIFNPSLSSYVSFSTGFNPPKLDDLSKSGKITKGFKLANPELTPETITTWEWGINWNPVPNLTIEPSIYYSLGNDFQYFVPNGDSIDTGGNSLKPVLQRQNISKVEISGFEFNTKWTPLKNLSINAWYAYNHSIIKKFDVDEENPAIELKGKKLAEVPEHTAFLSSTWQNKILNTTLTINYIGEMWGDEYNTILIEEYWMFDINLWKQITSHWRASLIVQDVFDRQPIDKKLRLSPGRFIMGKIQYSL